MDILIRYVDEMAIRNIDQQAKKMKMSRQVYLKKLLEQSAHREMFLQEQQRFAQVLLETENQITQYTHQQHALYEKIARIESILQGLLTEEDRI
ncbi:hypothetical protein A0U40_03425 [[Bacillus] sp. KCTC 13219]|nr:hypothetical protein A0U40_03425 [[Bacillus] sp. KCTC 13219]